MERADSPEKTRQVGLLCFRTACSKAALSDSTAIASKTRVSLPARLRKEASDVRLCLVIAPSSWKTAHSPRFSPTSHVTFSAPPLAEPVPLIQLSSSERRHRWTDNEASSEDASPLLCSSLPPHKRPAPTTSAPLSNNERDAGALSIL